MSWDGRVELHADRIDFIGGYRPEDIPDLCKSFSKFLLAGPQEIYLNFSKCTNAFPNSMLPLISMCARLRGLGYEFIALLPKKSRPETAIFKQQLGILPVAGCLQDVG